MKYITSGDVRSLIQSMKRAKMFAEELKEHYNQNQS